MASSHLIFLGTYTRTGTSKGIYAVRLDGETGALSAPELAAESTDPAWITLSPDRRFLYAIHASPAQAVGFAVTPGSARLTPFGGTTPRVSEPRVAGPSHLAVDATGRTLLAANYADGYVSAIAIRPDGTLGQPNSVRHAGHSVHPTRQEKPHAHSVTVAPDNRHVIVCDLGVDKIFSYALDPSTASLSPAAAPYVATQPGAGPRHFKFSADGRFGYAINELANTITAYGYDAVRGALEPRQTVSTLPAGFSGENTTAEIRIHPNGRFVYGSNRGHDSIAVFTVDPASGELSAQAVQLMPTGGKTPRNFALSPDGKWLVCGHQDSEYLTVFHVGADGRLSRTEHTAAVPACVCVLFYD